MGVDWHDVPELSELDAEHEGRQELWMVGALSVCSA